MWLYSQCQGKLVTRDSYWGEIFCRGLVDLSLSMPCAWADSLNWDRSGLVPTSYFFWLLRTVGASGPGHETKIEGIAGVVGIILWTVIYLYCTKTLTIHILVKFCRGKRKLQVSLWVNITSAIETVALQLTNSIKMTLKELYRVLRLLRGAATSAPTNIYKK